MILFISDLHLCEAAPAINQRFFDFLAGQARGATALYILGDLFEVWIGDDDLSPLHRQIIQALHDLNQTGIPVYFMHGNRDFLIGKRFFRMTGCEPLADPTVINLFGKKIMLMHGDTLCTRDINYIKFRRKMHRPWLQWLFLRLPLSYRRKIANGYRQRSMKYNQNLSAEMMDVAPEEVERAMTLQNVQWLIHGHTHMPAFHSLKVNDAKATRIVLAAWYTSGNYLELNAQGEFNLRYF